MNLNKKTVMDINVRVFLEMIIRDMTDSERVREYLVRTRIGSHVVADTMRLLLFNWKLEL